MGFRGQKGRRISRENLIHIYNFINDFKPKNRVEERNLAILKYAFLDNMSAETISKLKDPLLVSYSNNNRTNNISSVSIRRIINSYNLVYEKEKISQNTVRRNNDYKSFENIKKRRLKVCSCCGNKEKLNLHHIIPLYLGGNNDYYNLIYLCDNCHKLMHEMLDKKMKKRFIKRDVSNNLIEIENIRTYPQELINFLEENKNEFFDKGRKIKNYTEDFLNNIENIIKDHDFIVYHFTKIVDEDDYFENGICNSEKIELLNKITLKNLIDYYNIDDIPNIISILKKDIEDYEKYVYFSYTKNDIITNESLQGTLTKYYGGERLINLFSKNNIDINILKKIGMPAYIKFYIKYDINDIFLKSSLADCYYSRKFLNFDYNGHEGQIKSSINSFQIMEIKYLNTKCDN